VATGRAVSPFVRTFEASLHAAGVAKRGPQALSAQYQDRGLRMLARFREGDTGNVRTRQLRPRHAHAVRSPHARSQVRTPQSAKPNGRHLCARPKNAVTRVAKREARGAKRRMSVPQKIFQRVSCVVPRVPVFRVRPPGPACSRNARNSVDCPHLWRHRFPLFLTFRYLSTDLHSVAIGCVGRSSKLRGTFGTRNGLGATRTAHRRM
jgi:hypothetical protein